MENLLYSRYLRRVNSSKIIETFDDYANEYDIYLNDEHLNPNQNFVYPKLPKIVRRLSGNNIFIFPSYLL